MFPLPSNPQSVLLANGDRLDVRESRVVEHMSRPFEIELLALSPSTELEFDAIVGGDARFEIRGDGGGIAARSWSGLCESIELMKVEDGGLSTYSLRIVPRLWLLSQRRNYRVFQDQSELDIVMRLLADWGISPILRCGGYPARRYRVQYAESDLAFMQRMLEDIGVAYHFEQAGDATALVLSDAPNRRAAATSAPFVSAPHERLQERYVTEVRTRRRVRPGRYTQSDVDYRKPLDYPLAASSQRGIALEQSLERYHHNYGSFLWKGGIADTPFGDDRGPARTSEVDGKRQVDRRLEAQRADARVVTFRTTVRELAPGVVMTIQDHPRSELGEPLLVTGSTLSCDVDGNWVHSCEAVYASLDFRPPLVTPKPRTLGVESATVTGPVGEEIHTDEMGRVRVVFHWDRAGSRDATSSCWVPVSQAWAGAGMGAVSIPRVGQEVLVDFLGADPDRPIVMGRVFTTTTPPPYKLPDFKTVGGLRSETYPRPKPQAAMGGSGSGPGPALRGDVAPPVRSDAGLPATSQRGATSARPERRKRRAPAGGGPRVGAMGAGGPAAAVAPGGVTLPGPFGGIQAALGELSDMVSGVLGAGPDGMDTQRPANAVTMEDAAGKERLYFQGMRDMAMSVGNNLSAALGNNRVFHVARNDTEIVGFHQSTVVGADRTVSVGGDQTHTVQGNITVHGMSKFEIDTVDEIFTTTQTGQTHLAALGMWFSVNGTANVIMLPDGIVIDAPTVFINPGKIMIDALRNGLGLDEALAAVEAAKAADEQLEADIQQRFGDLDGYSREQLLEAADEADRVANEIEANESSYLDANGVPRSIIQQVGGLPAGDLPLADQVTSFRSAADTLRRLANLPLPGGGAP